MLAAIFRFYLEGLASAFVTSLFIVLVWMLISIRRGVNKTAKSKQAMVYDGIVMVLVMTPVLSFAFMAIILMFHS